MFSTLAYLMHSRTHLLMVSRFKIGGTKMMALLLGTLTFELIYVDFKE